MYRVYAQQAKKSLSLANPKKEKVDEVIPDDVASTRTTAKDASKNKSSGKNNNMNKSQQHHQSRRPAVWLFRVFFIASMTCLLGMVLIAIPASVALIAGNNGDATLTLRASLSAELRTQADRKPGGIVGDCRNQANALEKATTAIDPSIMANDSTALDELLAPFRSSSCSALWNASPDMEGGRGATISGSSSPTKIHVVVSYCSSPLYWLLSDLEELKQEAIKMMYPNRNNDENKVSVSVSVFSKCDNEHEVYDYIKSATFDVKVHTLPNNRGGHHHTYAHWMAHFAQEAAADTAAAYDYVFFLKAEERGNNKRQQPDGRGSSPTATTNTRRSHSLVEMLRMAQQPTGFACGSSIANDGLFVPPLLEETTTSRPRLISAYHCTEQLHNFSLKTIPPHLALGLSDKDRSRFASDMFPTLGTFLQAILPSHHHGRRMTENDLYTPVCLDDAFAVSFNQIVKKNDATLYETMAMLLQGKKTSYWAPTEEAFYAQRLWASLLSEEEAPSSSAALKEFGTKCRSSDVDIPIMTPSMMISSSNNNNNQMAERIHTEILYAGALERPLWKEEEESSTAPKLETNEPPSVKIHRNNVKMVNIGGAEYPEHVAEMILQMRAGQNVVGKTVSYSKNNAVKKEEESKKDRYANTRNFKGVPNYILNTLRGKSKGHNNKDDEGKSHQKQEYTQEEIQKQRDATRNNGVPKYVLEALNGN